MRFGTTAVALGMLLTALVALSGCGGRNDEDDIDDESTPRKQAPPTGILPAEKAPTFEGRVVAKGNFEQVVQAANDQFLKGIKIKADSDSSVNQHCLMTAPDAEKQQQEWIVNPANRGIKNAYVVLVAPRGYFLAATDTHPNVAKAREHTKDSPLKLHQPHCAFVPHALAVLPYYRAWDAGAKKETRVKTDEQLVIVNDAQVAHNYNFKGDKGKNDQGQAIATGTEKVIPELRPERINVTCGIHPWMSGYIWAFDHPYFAITDADGKFSIPQVPVASADGKAKVKVLVWHESGQFGTKGGEEGEEIDLSKPRDFEIEVKR
jgi:hypothetical protein